jgi:hypothetical protein
MTPSDSARSTPSASESCESTGQMSLFGETCERLTPTLLPTPVAYDATPGGPNNHYQGLAQQASKGLLPTPQAADSWEIVLNRTPEEHERRRRLKAEQGINLHYPLALAAKYPSSLPAIPASHSQSPGSDWARKMTATYGRKFADWYLSSGPVDACLRTLLGTSTWASMTCYLTWKRSATPAGRLLFRLVPSTPRTGGIGSGYWGTPRANDWKMTGNPDLPRMQKCADKKYLGAQVLMPTPRVEGFDAGKHRGNPDSLHSYAKMWPTPTVDDSSNVTRKGGSESDKPFSSLTRTATANSGMKLSSAWVSRMMGYPDGWMDVGEETR